MKKSLFVLIASGLLAGSAFAQTAVPAVNAAAAKVVAAPAAIASAAKAAVTPTTPAAPVAAPATTAAPAAKPAAATTAPAAGGGAGKVWVNGKVYHCEGTKFYGKTKQGEYMSEADAKAKGAHGVKGQVCSK